MGASLGRETMRRILFMLGGLAVAMSASGCNSTAFNVQPTDKRTYVVDMDCREVRCCPSTSGPPRGPRR